ncbi:MAG: NAD-binding protein [bacterium]|nr:NAD-binding protein [bacterium]
MNIVVVGGGKVGYYLVKKLVKDGLSVTLIEKDRARCEEIAQEIDTMVINGDGCDIGILEQAGISKASVLAAVTGSDEDNFVACQLAKTGYNVLRTVARVNNPNNEAIFSELGVDVPVNSTTIIARIVEEEVSLDDFINLLSFKKGNISLVRVDLSDDSPAVGKMIKDIILPPNSVLVSIIRGGDIIIPKGETVLTPGDDVIALTSVENEQSLLTSLIGKIK